MDRQETYKLLVDRLVARFGQRLKLIVLFGSQSRAEARPDSDHDIFVVIEDLPVEPLARQREVMVPLLPVLLDLPERLSIIAKTPQELSGDIPPLVKDVCMDGQALYGETFFAELQAKVKQLLHHTGLQRRHLAGTWMWTFPTLPGKAREIDWEDYREPVDIFVDRVDISFPHIAAKRFNLSVACSSPTMRPSLANGAADRSRPVRRRS